MFFPPPEPQPDRSVKEAAEGPNIAILVALWLFAVTMGPFFGYLPPRFQPRWLCNLVFASIFTVWIGLGIAELSFGDGIQRLIPAVVGILVGIAGLGVVFLNADTGAN